MAHGLMTHDLMAHVVLWCVLQRGGVRAPRSAGVVGAAAGRMAALLAAAFLLLSAGGVADEPFDGWITIPHPLFNDLVASHTATNATTAMLAYPERTQLNTSDGRGAPKARREIHSDSWTAASSESRSVLRFCCAWWRIATRKLSSAARNRDAPHS